MNFPMKRMNISCNEIGKWLLIIGPQSIRPILAKVIVGLALEEPVRVLDCGKFLNGVEIAMHLRDKPDALARVSFARASSCPEALKKMEAMPSIAAPFVILNLLHPFYNDDLSAGTRKRLLKGCLEQLERLAQTAGGVVSVCPPKVPDKDRTELFKMIEKTAASDVYRVELVIPSPELRRFG